MSYASNTCVSEWKRHTCRRGSAHILVSQCSRKRILQKPSRDSRWWIYHTGMSRGQDTHAGKAYSERAGPGKTGTGMEPCSTLRVWLAHRASCHPANARWPRNCEVTQRQKCALFFTIRRSGSSGSALSIYRGPLDTSTIDAKALRASAGWRAKARV